MTHHHLAERAAGAVVGAFIGDALGLGPHWYYDLDDQRRDYGAWIDGYTAPKAGRYHAGLEAGELSQTGLIMNMLLQSIAVQGDYNQADFTRRLDEELLPRLDGKPNGGPGGYTNHSMRQVWQARVAEGRPWGETAGNADTTEAAERLTILAARYAAQPVELAWLAAQNCRLSQNDSLVEQQSVAFALVLAALIRGEPFDAEISDRLTARVRNGEIYFYVGVAQPREPEKALGYASPDALLLPGWIAEMAHDPGVQIEPAWKVCLVYGMACAINSVLPGAYYLAARFPGDFESAVLHALNGGGQNMSRACLAGALVGAQVGLDGIPRRFVEGLRGAEEIVKLARLVGAQAAPA